MISDNEQQEGLKAWSPEAGCQQIISSHARLSAGFLRSAPAAWFPGLASHWLPFQHSSGLEMQILEVRPVLSLAASSFEQSLEATAGWIVDEESFVLYSSSDVRSALAELLVPDLKSSVKPVLIEYLARRLAISLLSSWSGFEITKLVYDSEMNFSAFQPEAFISARINLNNQKISFGFGLSKGLVQNLDGLWRRQIRASRRSAFSERYATKSNLHFKVELARLSLAPNAIASYLNSGSIIDLEMPVSDNAIICINQDAWLGVRLKSIQDNFVFEVTNLSPVLPQPAAGTTALCIEFGEIILSNAELVEYEQPGAVIQSSIKLSNLVQLSIRGETVASAELLNYQGRWALKIL